MEKQSAQRPVSPRLAKGYSSGGCFFHSPGQPWWAALTSLAAALNVGELFLVELVQRTFSSTEFQSEQSNSTVRCNSCGLVQLLCASVHGKWCVLNYQLIEYTGKWKSLPTGQIRPSQSHTGLVVPWLTSLFSVNIPIVILSRSHGLSVCVTTD